MKIWAKSWQTPDLSSSACSAVVSISVVSFLYSTASEIAEKDLSHLQEDHSISDMGIDSLAMLELVGTMERELSIRVPDDKLVGLVTIRQLLELVEGRITQAA